MYNIVVQVGVPYSPVVLIWSRWGS